jgi:outer membrane protein TolC
MCNANLCAHAAVRLVRPAAQWTVLLVLAAAGRASAQPGAPPPRQAAEPAARPSAAAPQPAASTARLADVDPEAAPDGEGRLDFVRALREGAEPMNADQAAAAAVQTSTGVRRAQAASARAREAASQALVAVYPRLDLEARYTRLSEHAPPDFGEATFMTPGGGQTVIDFSIPETIEDQFLLQARIAYPVTDLFFQILPRHSAAKEAVRAQELGVRAEAETVALQAREAYFNYARARATLLVARSGLAQSEAQHRDVNALVSAGTLARVELMRAEAQVATAQVALARAQGAVAIARTALRSLLHRPGDQDISIVEELAVALPPLQQTKDQLLQLALRQRAELLALRIMAGVHETTAEANAADKLPKLTVAANYDFANPNQRVDPYNREWNGSWAAMGILSWSPNDFATAGARAGQSEADRAQTLAELSALEDALRQEIAQGFEDYEAARQAMESALTGIRAAEESYRVRREQFRAGAAVATDVIDAESELRRARLELINAAIDVRIARARLDRAVGRGQPG